MHADYVSNTVMDKKMKMILSLAASAPNIVDTINI